jgi:hypothetical protein
MPVWPGGTVREGARLSPLNPGNLSSFHLLQLYFTRPVFTMLYLLHIPTGKKNNKNRSPEQKKKKKKTKQQQQSCNWKLVDLTAGVALSMYPKPIYKFTLKYHGHLIGIQKLCYRKQVQVFTSHSVC